MWLRLSWTNVMDAENKTTGPVVAKRSYKAGHVAVAVAVSVRGYSYDSAKVDVGTNLTTAQARALAQSLVALADAADAKIAAQATAEARRQKWRDREVAAGRIIEMNAKEFFHAR